MAFSLKSALTHVPFDDSILFEVYRSIAPVVVASIGVRPCDAFICTSRTAAVYEVYIAFLDTLTKTVHVFASDAQESGLEEYKGLMQEANQFLSGLGFSLEKVNIDFSPGIRQVVIRDIRVMHPPAQCSKARIFRSEQKEGTPVKKSVSISGTAGAAIALPAVAAESIAAAGAAAAAVAAASAHKKKSDDRLTLWVEKDAPRQEMHILQKMFSEVSAELAVLREERQNSEAELRGMRDALVRETLAASRLMEELDQLREANSAREAQLEERVAAVETELHKAQKEVAATRKKLRETRSELKDYAQSAELAAVVEVREQEIHRLTEELALVREAAAAVECRLNAEVETATAELTAMKLDAFNDRQRWDREVSDLQGELQVAKDSFAEAQAEQEKRHREVLARKEEEMLHVTEEKNRLREHQGSESAELRREVVLLRNELEDARCRHEEETALLLTECRQARQEAARLTDHLQLLEKVASEAQSCVGTSTRNAEDAVAAIELEVQHLREAAASREAEHQASIAELQAKLDAEGVRAREADETLAHLQKDYRRLTMERPTLLAAARKAKRLQEEVRGHVERDQKRESVQVKKSAEAGMPEAALPEEITPVRAPEPAVESSDATLLQSEEASGFHMDMPSWGDTLSALMADGCGFAPADFGTSGIDFLVDPTVHHVDIASAEDIIALYESMNHVQAMPDGRGLKRCGAYVCVIRTESGPRVFNVWSLVEEGKALVALPSQPETSDSWEGIIKDALFYFESVGFIMEPVDLASNRQKNRAMTKVPILRKRAECTGIADFQSRAGLDLRREQQVVVVK